MATRIGLSLAMVALSCDGPCRRLNRGEESERSKQVQRRCPLATFRAG